LVSFVTINIPTNVWNFQLNISKLVVIHDDGGWIYESLDKIKKLSGRESPCEGASCPGLSELSN
jgi:hypothetical protein